MGYFLILFNINKRLFFFIMLVFIGIDPGIHNTVILSKQKNYIEEDAQGNMITVFKPYFTMIYNATLNLQSNSSGNNFDISSLSLEISRVLKTISKWPNAQVFIEEQPNVNFRGKKKNANIVTVGNCSIQSSVMSICVFLNIPCIAIHPKTWQAHSKVMNNLKIGQLKDLHRDRQWLFLTQINEFETLNTIHEYDALFIAVLHLN